MNLLVKTLFCVGVILGLATATWAEEMPLGGGIGVISVRGERDVVPSGYAPPVLGNGNLCVQVDYQGCQFQRTYAGMTPTIFWAGRRYGPPNDQLVPFGHFEQEVTCQGKTFRLPTRWTETLNVREATVRCECDYGDLVTVGTTVFVPLGHDVVAIRKRFLPKNPQVRSARIEFTYAFCPPGNENRPPRRTQITAMANPGDAAAELAYQVDGLRMFDGLVAVVADKPVAAQVDHQRVSLVADIALDATTGGEITFYLVLADSLDGKDFAKRATAMQSQVKTEGFEGLLAAHRRQWADYWGESYIHVPEVRMEQAYLTSQYHLRTIATRWSFPVGLFNTHWAGRFFGWDEMFVHLAAASSNHLAISKRVPEFRRAGLEKAVYRTAHYGKPGTYGARYPWETLEDGSEGSPPGYWMEHVFHMSNIAVSAWFQYLYSGDREYLKATGYPVIKECANFYFQQMLYESPQGGLIFGKCTDLERLGPAKLNPFMTSCGAIFTLEAASRAAGVLGIDAQEAGPWKQAAAKLRESLPHNGQRYVPYAGCPDESIAVLGGVFPYPVFDASQRLQKNAVYWFLANGGRFGNMYPVGGSICPWYGGWMATALAALGDKNEPAKLLSQVAQSTGRFSEIFEINEAKVSMRPWFSTAEGNYVYALNQMLVQSRDDEILIAPATPDAWKEFSFKLPCYGNMLVEVRVKDGRIVELVMIPGDAACKVDRTLVIPRRLIDRTAIGRGLAGSTTIRDDCLRMTLHCQGKTVLLHGGQ